MNPDSTATRFYNIINNSDTDENDGTGPVIDVRYSGLTYAARPLFYFYNDRLDKPNELDHNTKYMVHYSKKANVCHLLRFG